MNLRDTVNKAKDIPTTPKAVNITFDFMIPDPVLGAAGAVELAKLVQLVGGFPVNTFAAAAVALPVSSRYSTQKPLEAEFAMLIDVGVLKKAV